MRNRWLNIVSRASLVVMLIAGVSLVGLGITGSLGFGPGASPTPLDTSPPVVIVDPSSAPSATIPPTNVSSPSPSLFPTASPTPLRAGDFVTRVAVPKLGINLPVVRPAPNESFPMCDVAEYITGFAQPGQGGVTYIYAHARNGMFWPLLRENRATGGKSLLGLTVLVYTSDDLVFTYKITAVALHIRDLSVAYNWNAAAKGEAVMLQTSETGSASGPKMAVIATLVSFAGTSYANAHPTPHPYVCS